MIGFTAILLPFQGGCIQPGAGPASHFPVPLDRYDDAAMVSLWDVLRHRVSQAPLNFWVTLLFFGAVAHTFLAPRFLRWSHRIEARNQVRPADHAGNGPRGERAPASARVLHLMGEVELVFGIWCVPLCILLVLAAGWKAAFDYLGQQVSYQEAIFVVAIMAIASTRPILQLAERCIERLAALGGGGPGAWWFALLTAGPLLGSLITEPAAMTISALLLGKQFFARRPSPSFAYATLGLLFVNVSVGGVLTHFAAPPVLMVARPWGWTTPFMARHFGVGALTGILAGNALYYFLFRREFSGLGPAQWTGIETRTIEAGGPPMWVTCAHAGFMVWVVVNAHHPVLIAGGFLCFLVFFRLTRRWQEALRLRSPVLVGVFLAGLVVHGGLQQWWIAPVLGRLGEIPLMFGAVGLTAFNDNAAITFLASLVPGLTPDLKHAVVAGAVSGGGLTVIANAPNPAGQSILSRFFPEGISAAGLFLGALPATLILALCFIILH